MSVNAHQEVSSFAAQRVIGRVLGNVVCVRARIVLDVIAETAHACRDPGLLNLEAINAANPTHPRFDQTPGENVGVGVIHTTAPCGELPLLPNEVCHLGSLNLAAFVHNGTFDFAAFADAIPIALRCLDDAIDISEHRLPSINAVSRANRKVGLGVMGLADVLAELELPYASPAAREFAVRIATTLQGEATRATRALAAERGPFPNWTRSRHGTEGEPRRNATLTSIAPTGHIAVLAGCSTSIEPYYLLAYEQDAAGRSVRVCHPLERKLAAVGYSLKEWVAATQRVTPDYQFKGTLATLIDEPTGDPVVDARLRELKIIFQTAHEITPEDHLLMVEAFQPHVDNGISKTINLPHKASVADVHAVLLTAIQRNVKGITVFRDGSLPHQALNALDDCESCG